MKNSALQGGILVAFGAASYGMLTTFVKLANLDGFSILELTLSQYLIGLVCLIVMDLFFRQKPQRAVRKKPTTKNIRNLILAGTSLGFTSLVYYFSVQYISVSIAIVLLMQSVWIGIVLDAVFNKTKPGPLKIGAVIVVLGGTVLATNLLFNAVNIDWQGIALGLLAAFSYSVTIFASNRIALSLPAVTRSKWMALGATIVVLLITLPFINHIHWAVFYQWGLVLGLFGTLLPPLLLNAGMPKVNLGIGAIITAIELPVAVSMAYFLLGEHVNLYQWIGIILILIAIVAMNLKKIRKSTPA